MYRSSFHSATFLLRFFLVLVSGPYSLFAQELVQLHSTAGSLHGLVHKGQNIALVDEPGLVSFTVNGENYQSNGSLPGQLTLTVDQDAVFRGVIHRRITFSYEGMDTLVLENIVPLASPNRLVYLTGYGNHPLSRAHLFLPQRSPVNVILPDNAWELGYAAIPLADGHALAGLARRDIGSIQKGKRSRFTTTLYPGGQVSYDLYFLLYQGNWQQGLRRVFQEHKLFDVRDFDRQLYERADLHWIQQAYVMHLFMAWDHDLFAADGTLVLPDFLAKAKRLYGGDDAIGIWPTWPTLGLDQRNQFDLFRDLPGGLSGLRDLSTRLEAQGSGLFVCYNPWDVSTRGEDHLEGLSRIVRATQARGVVLDTHGASSFALQAAADAARPGVIMYSEGMAVPRDMQGIVAGRVHNALYYPPLLNLNRLIEPEFAVFRVAELAKEPIRREIALAYFNGHGIEFNVFAPGRPAWLADQYRFLGQTVRVLRDHSSNFSSSGYLPLLPTLEDAIQVNAWPGSHSTVYTIFSALASGFQGALFEVEPIADSHYFDLFHYREVSLDTIAGATYAKVDLPGFASRDLGTNNEGAVGGIARYRQLLSLDLQGDRLGMQSELGDSLLVWAGRPSYEHPAIVLPTVDTSIFLQEHFGTYEGDFVVQLFSDGALIDQGVVSIPAGTPRLISQQEEAPGSGERTGMVVIPAGSFLFQTSNGDAFISYPDNREGQTISFPSFLMDKYPVTNRQFKAFLEATKYQPADTVRFLAHWSEGQLPDSLSDHPVVYVAYEDARAYAKWAGKRLPTEREWQYAAQAGDGRDWPWAAVSSGIYREKEPITNTLTVFTIKGIPPGRCNLGNGELDPVGTYPAGANPFGLEDLVGSVWQLTNDVYRSGSYTYILLKGGAYFNPLSSWWYVQGGPRELHYRQQLLRVTPGFERSATIGFRCVQDLR